MIKFNRDKISACWMGKNIGGTMCAPYEGKRELNDIQGFVTKPGEALVNDDLDLQLVWLKAMEEVGPEMMNERILGEYWLSFITPHWNECGVSKSNMREGIFPPMSGEVNNGEWKHSNGAWIRTEIWACLYPGNPEKAIKHAYHDACVDHGFGEGTVIDEHAKGTPWQEVRELLVKDSANLGWFQAPANVAYVVLGLLYGECDFKRSMILAINCGDDTDCTGATVGATLGIMYGMDGIPDDWKQYIGDTLTVGCLLFGHCPYPKICTELTDRVMRLQAVTMFTPSPVWNGGLASTVYDGEDDFTEISVDSMSGRAFADSIGKRKPYSFSTDNVFCEVILELDGAPFMSTSSELTGTITIRPKRMYEQKHFICVGSARTASRSAAI